MQPSVVVNPDMAHVQPFKAIFILYMILRILLALPWWLLSNLLPSWRPRPTWNLSRAISIKFMQRVTEIVFRTGSVDFKDVDPEVMARDERNGVVWIEPRPQTLVDAWKDAAHVNNVGPAKVAGYWYGKRDLSGRAGTVAEPDEKVIYEVLMGAFVMGTASPDSPSMESVKKMLTHFPGFRRCFQVEHRKARGAPFKQQNAFPAALIDILAGYDYLVKDLGFKPENILVTGASSGSNLALGILRAIRDHPSLNLRMPGGLVVLSPAIDWGRSGFGPHSSLLSAWDTDYIHNVMGPYVIMTYLGNLPASEASTNPYVSPASLRLAHPEGMFKDFPPAYIVVGDGEMLLDETRVLRDRMIADVGADKVTYREIVNGVHSSSMAVGHPEELEETYRYIGKWVSEVFD